MTTGPAQARPPVVLVDDADHLRLSRLVVESAWRVDAAQADTLHELFTDDGELEVGQVYRGRNEIHAWGTAIEEAHSYPGIRHLTSNMRFASTGVDADARDTATGTTILTVYLADSDCGHTTTPWVIGEDHDRFVRTDHGWRFTHRTWTQLFSRDELHHPTGRQLRG